MGRQTSFWSGFALAVVASAALLQAQSAAQDDHSVYFGGWTLNRELSSPVGGPDGANGRGREGGGRGRGGAPGGGFGGGSRGGGQGGPPGGGGRGGGAPIDPQEMEKMRALMQEVMTPPAHWIVTGREDGTIVFTESDGRSSRFVPNDKTEKHQLTAGTVVTKTRWEKGQLRQEIALSGGMKAVRMFVASPETSQLTVTTTMEGGRGGARPLLRFVYDRDEER